MKRIFCFWLKVLKDSFEASDFQFFKLKTKLTFLRGSRMGSGSLNSVANFWFSFLYRPYLPNHPMACRPLELSGSPHGSASSHRGRCCVLGHVATSQGLCLCTRRLPSAQCGRWRPPGRRLRLNLCCQFLE